MIFLCDLCGLLLVLSQGYRRVAPVEFFAGVGFRFSFRSGAGECLVCRPCRGFCFRFRRFFPRLAPWAMVLCHSVAAHVGLARPDAIRRLHSGTSGNVASLMCSGSCFVMRSMTYAPIEQKVAEYAKRSALCGLCDLLLRRPENAAIRRGGLPHAMNETFGYTTRAGTVLRWVRPTCLGDGAEWSISLRRKQN